MKKAIIEELKKWKEPVTAEALAEELERYSGESVKAELCKLEKKGIVGKMHFADGSGYFLATRLWHFKVSLL